MRSGAFDGFGPFDSRGKGARRVARTIDEVEAKLAVATPWLDSNPARTAAAVALVLRERREEGSPDLEALQSPIGPEGRDDGSGRLFLAGEHTSRYFWGSVHGAYFSGQDAANVICATAPPCTDDDSWHVRDRPAHGCAWTQGHAARCAMTGTGRSGSAACQATCGSCDGR